MPESAPHFREAAVVVGLFERNCAEQAMLLIVWAGGEIERVRVTDTIVAEDQGPQARVGDYLSIGILELSNEVSGCRVECVDGAVAEVSDQNVIAERAEIGAGSRNAPGSI